MAGDSAPHPIRQIVYTFRLIAPSFKSTSFNSQLVLIYRIGHTHLGPILQSCLTDDVVLTAQVSIS